MQESEHHVGFALLQIAYPRWWDRWHAPGTRFRVMQHPPLVLPGPAIAPSLRGGSIFFVGTATVILRYGGFTILTDPNFLHKGDHVHLGYGMTSERLTEPALSFEQLPPIDFVLLSHYHGDHFDHLVADKLDRNVPIITTKHAATRARAGDERAPAPSSVRSAVTSSAA